MEKLRELCRKALRDCQEQKAAASRLESRVMHLERDKEILGWPATTLSCPSRLHAYHGPSVPALI